jgi:hypothetical protein
MSKLKIPADIPKDLMPIASELHRLHESCLLSAQGQFELGKQWRAANLVLGVPAAVLAAIAGGTGLAASGKSVKSSVYALFAAGFGAALTTLNPSRRVALAQASANAYLEIQTSARQCLTIDLKKADYKVSRERLDKLTAKRDEINRTAEPPNFFARWRANRNVENGGQDYEADSE